MKKQVSFKTATTNDFKVGSTVYDSDGNSFFIYEQYSERTYNAKTRNGGHVVVYSSKPEVYMVIA